MSKPTRQSYIDVVITTPVTIPYSRYSSENTTWWIGRALAALAGEAGLDHRDLDGLSIGSFSTAPDTVIGLTQHFGLSPRFIDFLPFGGAAAILGLRRAARAVQAGDVDIVACIGADTNAVDSFEESLKSFSRFSQDGVFPYGAGGPNVSFALIASHYMRKYGARREDFGKIAVAQRENALRNPNALFKVPLDLETYMKARAIAAPIHLFDCVMPCAGAEGFLVMREATAKAQGLPFARLSGSIERHNAFSGDLIQERGGWAVDVDELYAMAGLQPSQIDVIETYDDYPFISMMQFEDLGFCAKGEGAEFVRSHDLTIAGSFPHNTSGGQLSVGQAGVGGGFLGLVEAVRQVTGRAGATQVAKAKHAMSCGFGMINYDRGLASAAVILSGES
ncbi:thiolase family protein [Pseudotabrizicola sp. 4114]|uniref:thiolase family protein n=1 Tax=Pseudotabrizicola sp. 4114 TaxID=2817731 RepID=UPI002855C324|nr:acetyl-CoA acetyltransferase [Pseudorhodobacter sp. 4114]